MNILEITAIAMGLSMDALAVAIAAGASGRATGGRAIFRISFHFGLFQFLMPVLGWWLGESVADTIAAVDHWIAYAILGFIGARMILSGLNQDPDKRPSRDPSRGLTMVGLSIATSIDAFAVGLSLALLGVEVLTPAVLIGIITCAFSFAGMIGGRRLGARFGKRMEVTGGVILIAMGLNILIAHSW